MQIGLDMVLQILINLGGLVVIYVRLETRIAVIQTKIAYIEKVLRMSSSRSGFSSL